MKQQTQDIILVWTISILFAGSICFYAFKRGEEHITSEHVIECDLHSVYVCECECACVLVGSVFANGERG